MTWFERWLDVLRARLSRLLFRRSAESRLDEEFRFHIEMATESKVREGLSPEEARRRALLEFGGVERHKERMRDERGGRWLEDVARDLRYALRTLGRRPAFTVAALLTLSIGLGITTAVASVFHRVVLAPTPYQDPDGIVQIVHRGEGGTSNLLPAADVRRLLDGGLEQLTVGVSRFRDVALGGEDYPERVRGVIVTGETLGMLGVAPSLGRLPGPAQDVPGGPCVAVLSHDVWRANFGGDEAVVGRTARLDGEPCTVTAVMPEGFAFPGPYFAPGDLWLMAGPEGVDWTSEGWPRFLVFGRLEPGVSHAQAGSALAVLSARDPASAGEFAAVRWAEGSRDSSRARLLILLAAAVLVLGISLANFIALQSARAVDRAGELATRLALGAGRGRLVRLAVAETVLLAAAGVVGGLAVAAGTIRLIVALRSYSVPRMEEVAFGAGPALLCLALGLVAAVVAVAARTPDLLRTTGSAAVRRSRRGFTQGLDARRLARTLVVVETTFALVLLSGATLLLDSYRGLAASEPGFSSARLLHARVTPPAGRYDDDAGLAAFFREVEERVAAIPDVRGVTLTEVPPGVGAGAGQPFAIAGRERTGDWPRTTWRPVSPSYFRTLEIPRVRGERLEAGTGSRAAVVNQAFVRRFFPDDDAMGRRLHLVDSPSADRARPEAWTVVGVVADVHEEYVFTPPPPTVYVRFDEAPLRSMAILARTAGPPTAAVPALRAAIAAVEPDQPVYGLRDLDFILASEYDLNRLGMTLLAVFAAAALILAVAGIYGLVAHTVGQRLREIGIRIAVGASGAAVVRFIVGDYGRFVALGVTLGLAVVLALGNLLGALTPAWAGLDPRIVASSAIAITAAAVASAFLPARRAASGDPVQALKQE